MCKCTCWRWDRLDLYCMAMIIIIYWLVLNRIKVLFGCDWERVWRIDKEEAENRDYG